MSACNVLVQREAVHILVDGLSYNSAGVVHQISQKCFTIPTAHTAVASLGAGGAAQVFAHEAGLVFNSFDELVDGIEAAMPDFFDKHFDLFDACEFSDCEVYFAGWSAARRQPEAYVMRVNEPGAAAEFWAEKVAGTSYSAEPFKLQPMDGITGNPPATAEEFRGAGLTFSCAPEDLAETMTPLDLLHLLEIQRRQINPLRPGYPARHWVGGLALLTTITAEGISQRVMHRWEEDKVGEVITPQPINWRAWRASRTIATLKQETVSGLSRLQRERMEKKVRKGTLRAVS